LSTSAPLAGTTVVEIGHSVSAPFAGLILGQLGADVIKVEHPDGGDHARRWGPPVSAGGSSALFHAYNREKRSVAVDLRDTAERDWLRDFIVARADVVIQNLRPGSIEELGLGPDVLVRRSPRLIYCDLSAYGGAGPRGMHPGYDPLMQAFAGIMSVTGEEGRPPVRAGVSIVDVGTGMWSVIGIVAALFERARSGAGCVVGSSLYETALAWMGPHITEYSVTREEPQRFGSGAPQIVPYEMFETSDGSLMLAAGNDELFAKLCVALGHPEWRTDERFSTNQARVRHRALLGGMLRAILRTRPSAHWSALLDAALIPNAPLRTVSQVIGDEQSAALDVLDTDAETGAVTVGVPLRFDGRRPSQRRPAPALGEHDAELRAESSAPARVAASVEESR